LDENPDVKREQLAKDLYKACDTVILHEDAFIDRAFELGGVEGLEPEDVKKYIRYIADNRLDQLKMTPMYNIGKNPLPYMDDMLNSLEHTNFFENRATEYSRAATKGTWEEAFV
jgi:ribonucleoside-diphosphate reductase beta chain